MGRIFNKNLASSLAFTLAEVLIVIGILGIIAEITIPALTNNINNAQTKSALKVAYSTLSQAMTTASADNSGTIAGNCSDFDDVCLKNLFKQYLKYSKDCDSAIITNGCWATDTYSDGSVGNINASSRAGLALQNGMYIVFRCHTKACDFVDVNTSNALCGWIGIDVNGAKKPNKWGKDTFWFTLQSASIKPGGVLGDYNNVSTCTGTETGGYSGWGCTNKFLNE